ncbi:DNA replication factor C, large subunit [Guyanagaster necrorhizus]|uniref:Replication factor C subunit 1 n=1 Tax=Guyanagaster necrorhizus TaxID=856835 RepID=A0A9P7VRH7_9AGAR|nr:DNA replication factor C, large subunit [Guyanagaster necrorhizus MCA 3950]KAG7446101.1 DNA replication factor C, large subunit [Guyanagaster necrorhizus MCA 3950]
MSSAKASKTQKPAGVDIRAFMTGSSSKPPGSSQTATSGSSQTRKSSSQMTASSNLKRKTAVLSSDDDEDRKKPLPKKKPATTSPDGKPSNLSKVIEISDDETPLPPRRPIVKRKKPAALLSSDEDDEDSSPKKKLAPSTSKHVAATTKPRPSTNSQSKINVKKAEGFVSTKNLKDEDYASASDDDEWLIPKKAKAKPPPKKKAITSKDADGKGKEKTKDEPKKPNWAATRAAKLAAPVAHGSKDIPDGQPDCLMGLSFVFTGELSSFSREEAVDLAKRFGGRVVGQPSSRTDFVVLGDNAGPSKLAAIAKHKLKTLNEDEFLNLIATRKCFGNENLDEKTKKKMEKDQEAIKNAAKEMEKREKQAAKESRGVPGSSKVIDPSSQLWTTRYAPQSLKEICGNKSQVDKLLQWLNDWPQSLKSGFKKPGKNGMNIFRAVLITGSPGIGKTTSAHLCAKLAALTPIELNASDARSKKLVENGMNINNMSLDGFLGGTNKTNSSGVTITDRSCLIMDEVDGMSAGDRGGVGALNALIKKSKIPIICIANDRNAQKLAPLKGTTFSMNFSKPPAAQIRSRILTIAFKEKMKIPANVIDQLVAGSQSDIRHVLNMLSTWKLSSDSMSFDEGKALTKMNEKYSIMSPFDITSKMLGPYLFSATARETLGDKMELYFQDHSFMPLFIQENYLKTQPAKLRNLDGPNKILKELQLMDKAAASISDGDLVDGLIHGPEQHWSLMPLHAVCSAVRPASLLYGQGAHYGGPNSMSFPQWLGQNSKQNKLSRQLGDVQIRMRLKVSGDKSEIRQSYIPALFPHIVRPLVDEGLGAIDDVIDGMDEYSLSKEDWDTIVELGVDQNKDDLILKKIPPAVKSSFTRKYNSQEHPMPFHKGQDVGKAPKKLAAGPVPDLEDAFELDDIVDDASDDETKTKMDNIDNDKLIHVAKAKKKVARS